MMQQGNESTCVCGKCKKLINNMKFWVKRKQYWMILKRKTK